jgi:poly(hydroxyalkanoate) granule-associated protein
VAKVEVNVEETAEEVKQRPVQEATHKVVLAGVGVAAMAQEALADCLARFVERGELVEQETRQVLRDRMARRRHQVRKLVERRTKAVQDSEAELEAEFQGLVDRMNVPSKNDIDALSAKITELTKKVDELNAS